MRQPFASSIFTLLLLICAPKIYRVPTGAMSPTIKVGDSILTDETFYLKNPVQRFDIVLFKAAEVVNTEESQIDENQRWVMRVVGLGGETVEIKNGKVFINNKPLRELFKTEPSDDDFGPLLIPEGEFFILGDNRPNSADSRFWPDPTLSQKAITAKVIKVLPQEEHHANSTGQTRARALRG